MALQWQIRRDTKNNWTNNNPILAEGEFGIEIESINTPNLKLKVGNGVDEWVDLSYNFIGDVVLDQPNAFTSTGNNTFQGKVGIGTAIPQALLELNSTTSGLLLPRLTTVQVNAIIFLNPGLTVFNTTLDRLCFYDGSRWQKVNSSNM